ncbi:MAG: putative LINOLEOYL-CoA [Myxococcaceae bacterium]|nr:putative LINOLEOYL-CoA [Myxococcaceae bacterium]
MQMQVQPEGCEEDRLLAFSRALDELEQAISADLGATDLAQLEALCRRSKRLEWLGRALLQLSVEPAGFLAGVLALWAHACLEQLEIGHAMRSAPSDALAHEAAGSSAPSTWGYDAQLPRPSELAPVLRARVDEAAAALQRRAQQGREGRLEPQSDEARRLHQRLRAAALGRAASVLLGVPLLARPLFWKVALGSVAAEWARDWFAHVLTEGGRLHTALADEVAPAELGATGPRSGERTRPSARRQQVEGAADIALPWGLSILAGGLDRRIEHHLFPHLPPARLRQIAPRVRAICARHGVRYRKRSALQVLRAAWPALSTWSST